MRSRSVFSVVTFFVLIVLVVPMVASTDIAAQSDHPDVEIDSALTQSTGETRVIVRLTERSEGALQPTATEDQIGSLKTHAADTQSAFKQFAAGNPHVEIKQEFWITNALVVTVDTDRVPLERLGTVENVERLHRDFEVERTQSTAAAGGSAVTTVQPTLVSTNSESYTWGVETVRAPEVWETFDSRGEGVRIAVLDSGINATHPDLNVTGWKDFDDSPSSEPKDYGDHGTHVSGTVAGGNASGTHIGVAPEVELMVGAVLTDNGGTTGTFSAILNGMEWAVENDADIMSMSLGGDGYYSTFIDPVRNARQSGTFVVASSGNDGAGTSGSPGNVYEAVAVGATGTDSGDEYVASFTSGESINTSEAWGSDAPSDWPTTYVVPDVSAPGASVYSAEPGDSYTYKSGTSMAAPHVSGSVALLLSTTNETLSPDEIDHLFESTAVDIGEPETRQGEGRIDVYNATMTHSRNSIEPTITPDSAIVSESTEFSVDVDHPISSYHWTFPNGTTQTTTEPSVTHTFTELGTQTVLLTLEDTQGENITTTADIDVLGPNYKLSDSQVDFGGITVEQATSTTTFTVTNNGTMPLEISDHTITGSNPENFEYSDSNPATPRIVDPGSQTAVDVTFTVDELAIKNAFIELTTNVTNRPPINVSLTGAGVEPDYVSPNIKLTPTTTPAGVEYADIGSNGNLSVDIPGLNAGSSVIIDDVFRAEYNGTRKGTIYFEHSNPHVTIIDSNGTSVEGSSNAVIFSSQGENETFGVAVDATTTNSVSIEEIDIVSGDLAPTAEITPSSVSYGTIDLESSGTETVTISNTGQKDLEITGTSIRGTDEDAFNVTQGGSQQVIAPSASSDVDITFGPTATGSQSATLVVTHNGSDSPTNLSLSGIGGPPDYLPPNDEIELTPADTPEGQAYATLDSNSNLSVDIPGLNAGSSVIIDDVFRATYNGTEDAYIYFEDSDSNVTIIDSNGTSVEGSSNFVTFSSQGENKTFGAKVDATITNSVSISSITVGSGSGSPPTRFNGTVTDASGVVAPANTTIVATVDGSVVDSATVDMEGHYGGGASTYDDVALDVSAGDEVRFYVREKGGPATTTVGNYTVQESDVGTTVQQDLEFPAGTFDLQVEEFTVNRSRISPGETVSISANLTNDGGVNLTQDATLSIDGVTDQTKRVSVEAGTVQPVDFSYTQTTSSNVTVEISTDDDSNSTTITVDGIETVGSAAFDHDFVGIVEDDELLAVTASNVETASGAYDGPVHIRLNTTDSEGIDVGSVQVTDGEIDTTIDPATIPADTAVGEATLEIAGYQTSTSINLVHEAKNFQTGTRVTSVPQAAQLYTQSSAPWSAITWDASEQKYSSDIFNGKEFKKAELLHRGIYLLNDDPGLRFGYEYQSTALSSSATLSAGWNLVGSSYNISDGPITVKQDLNIADFSSATVVDANTGRVVNPGDASSEYSAYWVYTSSPQTRTINSSDYNPTARDTIAPNS